MKSTISTTTQHAKRSTSLTIKYEVRITGMRGYYTGRIRPSQVELRRAGHRNHILFSFCVPEAKKVGLYPVGLLPRANQVPLGHSFQTKWVPVTITIKRG